MEAAYNPPSYPKKCLEPRAGIEVKNFETYYPQVVRLGNSEQFGIAITKMCVLLCIPALHSELSAQNKGVGEKSNEWHAVF